MSALGKQNVGHHMKVSATYSQAPIKSLRFCVRVEIVNIPFEIAKVRLEIPNMLFEIPNMLFEIANILFEIANILFEKANMLFEIARRVFHFTINSPSSVHLGPCTFLLYDTFDRPSSTTTGPSDLSHNHR